MKAIIITTENNHNLPTKKVGDEVRFTETNLPKVWNNTNINYNNCEVFGFYEYEAPIVEPVVLTSQQLYDNLIVEGKQVFDEFRKMLSEASSPYVILGTIPIELQVLTQTMLDAKARILSGLDYYLSIDDVDSLKAFTYQTEEAEQLKQAIENFK